MGGWNLEDAYELHEVLDGIREMTYEIDNCVRGCLTNCKTYKELSVHIRELGERLASCADDVEYIKEERHEENE